MHVVIILMYIKITIYIDMSITTHVKIEDRLADSTGKKVTVCQFSDILSQKLGV